MAKKNIDFKKIEDKYKKFWDKEKIYKFNLNLNKQIFSIDTPPPYVSGKMHIGHAFSYSQQDFIARFRRMLNGTIFYPFGTDDNGLPTERFIEKRYKIKSKTMSRAKFIELCLDTLKKITPQFINDWKDLGISCNYEIYYSTIDKNSQKISQISFIELYEKGEIYKKEFPTLWCPDCQTSIAQADLENKEKNSLFSTLKFRINDKDLLISTTRPELLSACVAIFVNPQDKRYKNLIGKKAKVPLFNFKVPIIKDQSAEIDKGTGVLMICSYGDKFDVEAINKHKLTPKIILNKDGTLNIKGYEKLKIKDARKKILNELKKKNLIAEEKQISHNVNVHERCGTEIEFLPTEQWFTKIIDKKEELIKQGKKIKWYPKFMFKRYENWVNGLEWDWSISRDRHFGVPIPIWECKKCKKIILPEKNELPIDPLQIKKKCPNCNENATPEDKVLDTWMTSSLSPQITSSLIKNKIDIPFSLRPQAHDIIRTWAFYTIVKSYLHSKEIPWKEIIISGYVTKDGEKMSKSKGNVIEPKKVLENHGADALRFYAASSKLGKDADYQEKDLIAGKKLITKLINASKFVFMNLKDYNFEKPKKLEKLDELFLNELNNIIFTTTSRFKEYDYSKAKFNIEEFFWNDFCDNYLEIIKKRIYQGTGEKKKSTQYTLYKSLFTIIKIFAPIIPFITEEIYQKYFKKNENQKSIHISNWPKYNEKKLKKENEKDTEKFSNKWFLLKDLISKVRTEKTKMQKPMNYEITLTIEKKDKNILKDILNDLKDVTNTKKIKEGKFLVEI
jgi:valyl-tRNA synthetase